MSNSTDIVDGLNQRKFDFGFATSHTALQGLFSPAGTCDSTLERESGLMCATLRFMTHHYLTTSFTTESNEMIFKIFTTRIGQTYFRKPF